MNYISKTIIVRFLIHIYTNFELPIDMLW